MSIYNKRLKILLYGDVLWPYARTQTLMKFLLDSECCISLVSPNFYNFKGVKPFSILWKILLRLHLLELFIKVPFVQVIYILPLNTTLIRNAIWLAKLFKKKLVVEIYVSLYDTFVRQDKLFEEGSKRAITAIQNDILAMTKPDYIITTTECEPTYWQKLLGINIDRSKFFVAPIISSSNSTLRLKRTFMEDGIIRICWWGTFIPLHGLDNILEAMKLLKETKVKFVCNLFGVDNPSFSVYEQKIQSQQLESCVFLRKDLKFFDDSLPRYLIENCDLALGVFGETDTARHAFPHKLVEALLMGIPTLTMKSPALSEFLDPETDLWTCEPFPESIAKTILTIFSGTADPIDWQQTRQKVLNTFSLSQYQKVVGEILDRVTSNQ